MNRRIGLWASVSGIAVSMLTASSSAQFFDYGFSEIEYTQSVMQTMNGNTWVDESRNTVSFNAQKKPVTITSESYLGGAWATTAKSTLIYSGSRLDSISSMVWDDDAQEFADMGGAKITYNSAGDVSSVSMAIDMGFFVITTRTVIKYDNSRKVVSDTTYTTDFMSGGQMMSNYSTYTYGNGYQIAINYDDASEIESKDSTVLNSSNQNTASYEFLFDGSSYEPDGKTEWTYNNGKVTMELYSTWTGSDYEPDSRTIYTYDNSSIIARAITRSQKAAQKSMGRVINVQGKAPIQTNMDYFNLTGRKMSGNSNVMSRQLQFYRQK